MALDVSGGGTVAGDRSRATTQRGRGVLSELRSTEDFTHKHKLKLGERKLSLFLAVALTRECGCLARVYDAVAARFGGEKGHWASGKSVAQLSKACARSIGKGADRRLTWEKIVDVVTTAVPPGRRDEILAIAAGLYRRARGDKACLGEYSGDCVVAAWADWKVVTVDDIEGEWESPSMPEVPARETGDVLPLIRSLAIAYNIVEQQRDGLREQLGKSRVRVGELGWNIRVLAREKNQLRAQVRQKDLEIDALSRGASFRDTGGSLPGR